MLAERCRTPQTTNNPASVSWFLSLSFSLGVQYQYHTIYGTPSHTPRPLPQYLVLGSQIVSTYNTFLSLSIDQDAWTTMKAFSALLLLRLSWTAATAVNYQPATISSEGGRLEVTLNVDMLESLNGTRVGTAYNGEAVGPTLRAKPGDTVSVTLNNLLPPGSDLDRELFAYINDEAADDVNVTIIYNRLTEYGTRGAPMYGYWGQHYANLHFHG